MAAPECPRCHEAVPLAVIAGAVRTPTAVCANAGCQAALRWDAGDWHIDNDFESRRSYLRFYRQHAHAS